MDLLNRTDPSSVSLDEVKADQILSLTNNMLLLISSQTPLMKKLTNSCQFTHDFCSVTTAWPLLLTLSIKVVKCVSRFQ